MKEVKNKYVDNIIIIYGPQLEKRREFTKFETGLGLYVSDEKEK